MTRPAGIRASATFALIIAIGGPIAPGGAQVPFTRIVNAERDSASWLTYSGGYRGERHSRLAELTPANVARLRPAWVYQASGTGGFETTPLVADGVMYLTEAPSTVVALDARTGNMLWHWEKPMPRDLRTLGFPPVNRGVALLDSTVFVGTIDAHLVALDARTGAMRWDVPIADNKAGYAITAAPLAIDGAVVVGISGGEAGIRGFISDAYDARTGKRRWRFYTVPASGEPGNSTWEGDSWKTGGGATWLTGSYDAATNTLFWGVGNPGPDWNDDARAGDNLYTCSMVALDATTGQLRWHFQFTPHDTHDWDANQIPVLLDATIAGRPRKLIATANRNGFYYLLDRVTGAFVMGVPFAHQTWTTGLDRTGHPMVVAGSAPSTEGTLVFPSIQGATNWFSPLYSPRTGLFYIPVREMGGRLFKGEAKYVAGTMFAGGGEHAVDGDSAYGAVRAIDARTGKRRWEFRLRSPLWAGLLSTAGGLVFGGSEEGQFYALDALTGAPLWRFQTGAGMAAAPMAYLLGGHQHVVMASRHAVFVFALPDRQ